MEYKNIKNAFTFIELIIVISIIGILATLFLNGYRGTIQHARMESSMNELKSVMASLKTKANSGVYEKGPSCYGVEFNKNKNSVISFSAIYNTQKESCETSSAKFENIQAIDIYPELQISNIGDTANAIQNLKIFFYPPRGNILLFADDEKTEYTKNIIVTFIYNNFPEIIRKISIDGVTGNTEIN
jgi:prepilin-type N-terminal cleavage/methylation domain-containing protein